METKTDAEIIVTQAARIYELESDMRFATELISKRHIIIKRLNRKINELEKQGE